MRGLEGGSQSGYSFGTQFTIDADRAEAVWVPVVFHHGTVRLQA
jgi:hypothetical protein